MKQLLKTLTAGLLFSAIFMPVLAEDTELFVVDLADREGYRPKVLVIFDTSGSMDTQMTVQEDYDPNFVYPELDDEAGGFNNTLFYTVAHRGDDEPPMPSGSDHRYFSSGVNACAESLKPLTVSGRFTGYIREFETEGDWAGRWRALPNYDGRGVGIIDCLNDMNKRNVLNPYGTADYAGLDADGDPIIVSTRASNASAPFNAGDGYPYDSKNAAGPLYTDSYRSRNRRFDDSRPVTLYTINYLRWYHSVGAPVQTTRLAVAKEAVTNMIQSVPGVDFGLMVFNQNGNSSVSGGRIVRGIEQSSAASHTEIINIVDDLEGTGWTPLCETLYEAKRYFSADTVKYGDDDTFSRPPMDSSVADSGTYISPFDECSDVAYVILVTDGEPTRDNDADSNILALPNVTSSQKVDGNYLAALANYMHSQDIFIGEPNLAAYKAENQGREPKQTVTTYTIGFGEDAVSDAGVLLKETALRGGGAYFEATGSVGLESALFDALVDILLVDSSMTSPAIAANNFDRTRSLDNIYYSMFLPSTGPRWLGNIKKLKLDDSGILKDKNGVPAIDENGNIKLDAATFWDNDNDAEFIEDIAREGVNASLTKNRASRKILTNVGGALVNLNSITPSAESAAAFGVEQNYVTTLINWIYGIDVDDNNGNGSTTDSRKDIFSDPFHSKPLVMNLSSDPDSPDLRLVVGTNGGQLHFFKDHGTRVSESWSFLPQEFIASQNLLRLNAESVDKLYGIDGSPITYQHDNKTYLYFGLRRGGSSYYALDISSPDSPVFKWKIDASTSGFEELGQSWGRPVITKIPGYVDGDGKAKPVLIISGGYDSNKDTIGVGTSDSMGRGLFIVDAVSGALVWSITPRAATAKNVQYLNFADSMPAAPAILDSDSDGLTDRIYTSDTGGNIWRFDLYTADKANWTVYKFAQLGGTAVETDRRFFYTPTITRTLEKTVKSVTVDGNTSNAYGVNSFDAILLGTGDRTRLLSSKSVQDYFFMLKDQNTALTNFGTAEGEVPYPDPIEIASLADIASDPVGSASSDTERLAELQALSSSSGWRYQLAHNYEKAVGDVIVLQGAVYFTTFTPPGSPTDGVCVQMGAGRVYATRLHTGQNVHSWRSLDIGERVPDTLVVHSGVNEEGESTLRILGVGQGDEVGYDLNKDGTIGETEVVNSGNVLSNASMNPKKVHTHEPISY